MAEANPTLTELAATISEAAQALTSYLEANNLPAPSFAEDGPADYPKAPEVIGARFQLLGALHDLVHLAMGPTEYPFIQPIYWNHDGMVLDVLNQFNFFSAVPLGGSATYSEIAQATTVPESIVRRIVRHAMTNRIFVESPPGSGRVAHTATSAFLARNPLMGSWIGHNLEEARAAAVYLPESLRRFSAEGAPSEEVSESAFSVADVDRTGGLETYWDYLKRTPEGKPEGFRSNRFAEAMGAAAKIGSTVSGDDVVKSGYDWGSLGEATVVDVGGSTGFASFVLAKEYPKLDLIVQDLPEIEASFKSHVPQDLTHRVTFQPHDFFTPQTVPADVYFLKMILHDWPDKYAVRILRNLIPSLKPGGRILLCESVAPPDNAPLPLILRRLASLTDLQMLIACNSKERTLEDWQALAKEADGRLEARLSNFMPGSLWNIVELVLSG
ncbi:related to sterigmatocystin 8-O-methyltransferase precursor [Cephalotrichum gorgonifer]|uniref:Related to sterigmatocystin 8-O-methyltransferase n=1 Tax=Cephalotrichum gorgonifer TaxID=2041049 RepID=A0AAE8N5Z4_9PEZI|nr:related to sterigmatocystin 8-O-methyltransferase precursor [Cephalotrichum gorgonifer]